MRKGLARRGVDGFEGREHGQQPTKHKMMMRKMSRHPSTPLRVSAICFSACCCCRRIRSRSTSESTLSFSFRPFFQMLFCEWRQPYPVLHCPSLCLSSADVYIFPPPASRLFIPLRTMRLFSSSSNHGSADDERAFIISCCIASTIR